MDVNSSAHPPATCFSGSRRTADSSRKRAQRECAVGRLASTGGAENPAENRAHHLPPPVNSQQSTVNSQQSTVNSQQSTVNSQQSTVNSQQSTVNSQQSTVNRRLTTD